MHRALAHPWFWSHVDSIRFLCSLVNRQGITFSHTAPTFMKPFSMASGGDWSVRRDAAVVFAGTTACSVINSSFYGIGGNAMLLDGSNDGATISGNSFRFVGDSAIVSLGRVDGMDGTAQDVPRGTIVSKNMASEIGLYVKQAGMSWLRWKEVAAGHRRLLLP